MDPGAAGEDAPRMIGRHEGAPPAISDSAAPPGISHSVEAPARRRARDGGAAGDLGQRRQRQRRRSGYPEGSRQRLTIG